ncbi:hypothetical protein [Paenibacillus pseudetheri]|nr:hypothetical protein [Paenibacillus pseudetheri]
MSARNNVSASLTVGIFLTGFTGLAFADNEQIEGENALSLGSTGVFS